MYKATAAEFGQARQILEEASSPASLAQLGGFRPDDAANRQSSWWGGNFLGLPGELPPICAASGKMMSPILQIRTDELPHVPAQFKDIALLSLWFVRETWELEWFDRQTGDSIIEYSGMGFVIRSYVDIEGLVPIGPGYREQHDFPCFPIRWHLLENDTPDWEEFAGEVPLAVAQSRNSDWFFDYPGKVILAEMQKKMPVKVGGYPQWWQSPQDVQDGEFAFFMDSTQRGQVGFPAGGSANFFRTPDSWAVRVDFT